MARPTKQGIDYFPLDTEFDDDLQLFVTETGSEGIGILITIWQAIYKDKGYYIVCDDKFPLKIKQKCFSNVENIVNVVENTIKFEIFDKSMYEKYQILTSRGVQKRYFTAARAKKRIEIISKYILIDISNVENGVILVENEINAVGNATKEKEKEKGKGKELIRAREKAFETFWKAYPRKKSKGAAIKAWAKIKHPEKLIDKMLTTIEASKKTSAWQKDGGQYIPYPATWLNRMGWEDEIEVENGKQEDGGKSRNIFLEPIIEDDESAGTGNAG